VSLYNALAQNERGFKLLVALLVVVTAFTVFFVMQRQGSSWRQALLLSPDSTGQGEHVFRSKGCIHCHAVAGMGGTTGPDFATTVPQQVRLPQIVVSMWNHIPRMREKMLAENIEFPQLTYAEATQIFSFLYGLSRLDRPGNVEHGRLVFERKGCNICHSIAGRGGKLAKDLVKTPLGEKMAWAQAMITQAPRMREEMGKLGMSWPQFERPEMNDLLTYLQEATSRTPTGRRLLTGDPDAGWQVFQSKSCLVCHSVRDEDGGIGPSFGPSKKLPPSATGIAAVMWNKMPVIEREMQKRQLPAISFRDHELSDLIAFVQSLRYFEPTGSPQVGQSVFILRGCGRCHGNTAEGTALGHGLRQGRVYNSISLATALWRHGGAMDRQNQQAGTDWPILEESDVGDLLAFLNTPLSKKLARNTQP
jgi:mono/diheme cytochrome c family protein